MKTFSKLNESAKTTDTQPGNDLANTGITNHYTPIDKCQKLICIKARCGCCYW